MTTPTEEMKARAKRKAEEMRQRRLEHGYIAGTPGTLGDGNTNNSMGGDVSKPIRVEGLDDN